MEDHISSADIERLATRRLRKDRLQELDRHLQICEHCRHAVRKAANPIPVAKSLQTQFARKRWHVSSEMLELYVDGRVAGEESRKVEEHVATCLRCRDDLADLLAFKNELSNYSLAADQAIRSSERVFLSGLFRGPSRAPRIGLAFGLVLLACLVCGTAIWLNRSEPGPNGRAPQMRASTRLTSDSKKSQRNPKEPIPQRVVAQRKPRAKNAPQHSRPPDHPNQYGVADSQQEQHLDRALRLKHLPNVDLQMGAPEGDSVSSANGRAPQLVSPLSGTVLCTTPVLKWKHCKGATGYRVRVFESKHRLVIWMQTLQGNQTSCRVTKPLTSGVTYVWTVTGIAEAGDSTSETATFTVQADQR